MKARQVALAYLCPADTSNRAELECSRGLTSAFLASVPKSIRWWVQSSDLDADSSRPCHYLCDVDDGFFWSAAVRSEERGIPDSADPSSTYTVTKLGVRSELLSSQDIARKLCDPLCAVGASAIVINLPLEPPVVEPFLGAGFRVLGSVSGSRIEPRVDLPALLRTPLAPAIVLGRPNPNMLAQLRALGRCGVPVHCIVVRGEPATIARVSRYATGVVDLRSGGDRDVIKAIMSIAESSKAKPVLFFGGDLDISLSARIWNSISEHVRAVSDPVRAEALNAKTEQGKKVSAAGIRVPQGGGIRTSQDLETLCASLQFPVICRPVELASRGGFSDKIIIAQTAEEMRGRLSALAAAGDSWVLAQEYVPGPDESLLFALASCGQGGRVTGIVTGRKLCQYPAGLMCRGEAMQDSELKALATKAFEALGVEGVLGVEFKQHAQTGELYYIEVNFRPENIIAITEAAGVNVLLMAYLQTVGRGTLMLSLKMQPALWRDFSMELLGWVGGKFPWSKGLNHPGKRHRVGALWAADDPFPAFAWHASKAFRAFAKLKSVVMAKASRGAAHVGSGRVVR